MTTLTAMATSLYKKKKKKKVANGIVEPLTRIITTSISTGIVPEKLKIAKVIPTYKKDDAEKFSNY